MRRTKIVATLGPASEDKERLKRMIRAGLDVARINFSHGNAKDQRMRVEALRAAANESGR
ncbi:MAG TPA: pyruvate kinase, partial [Woeseiaceae bacterium]|nr:pyruvate kinase [Woeseiaceae bacterium]